MTIVHWTALVDVVNEDGTPATHIPNDARMWAGQAIYRIRVGREIRWWINPLDIEHYIRIRGSGGPRP